MSYEPNLPVIQNTYKSHKNRTRDVLDGGSEGPITAFCFWSHLCQKDVQINHFVNNQSIHNNNQ